MRSWVSWCFGELISDNFCLACSVIRLNWPCVSLSFCKVVDGSSSSKRVEGRFVLNLVSAAAAGEERL